MKVRGIIASVLASTALLAATSGAALADCRGDTPSYVALGDSVSSGVGSSGPFSDPVCLRSPNGFPQQLADISHASSFTFAACSGATTAAVTANQLSPLTTSTSLVTITIGGNDLGFTTGIGTCAQGTDADCLNTVVAAEQFAATTLPSRLDAVYAAIKQRAPRARLLVAGYAHFFELTGDCAGQPFDLVKRTALNDAVDALDRTIATRAAKNGARFVDVRHAFDGHGLCGTTPWMNGLTAATGPFHPNDAGYRLGYLPVLRTAAGRH
ncbi:SGNH/GDSL hydrolase family protein [Actinoplanes sp. NPDC049596]|uniref:SGNH/GDSL hydrolase family protein n=1 Tax=unclassified Actinoplanes TaxID=2626549 RepID=UPI00341D705A